MTHGLGPNRTNGNPPSTGDGCHRRFGRRTNRSISAVLGIVLLFGMVLIGAAVLAVSGMALIDSLQSDSAESQGLNELDQLDHTLTTQGYDSDSVRSFALSDGAYEMVQDGTITITAKGQFAGSETVVDDLALQTISLETDEGQTVGYQAGGVFVGTDDSSRVHSEPALSYETRNATGDASKHLSFSVVDLQGNLSTGENRVEERSRERSRETLENIRYVAGVEIRIENTTYHHAWDTFLSDEFGHSAVTHYEHNQTVVVEADIDHNRPFSQYVNLYPTIYGGLHAGANSPVELSADGLTIDSYDSRDGPYVSGNTTADLFTVDTSELRVTSAADIDGLPVANENLKIQPGASVTPFAFYEDSLLPPSQSSDVLTANFTEPFDTIEPVTDEVTNQAIPNLKANDTALTPNPGPGLYYRDGDATLTHETIDTGSGNTGVHIGVTGDLTMKNVDLTGTGQAHLYVTGDEIDLTNVDVPDHNASSLWIYATENTSITIGDRFEGVVYAPGSDELTIEDGTDIYGSVVGGTPDIGDDVAVHFDESLRSAEALSEEDLNQSWSSTEPNELDVSFVLDSTGSMEWNDPDDLIKPATQNAIGMLTSPYHRAGVYEFDQSGRTLHDISGDLDAVHDSVVANEDGGTDISTGIEHALDRHAAFEDPDREKHMILMTDGENSPVWWGPDPDEKTLDQAERAAANNVTIWTIAFSDNADADLMGEIASITGGESETVEEAADIEDVMEQFLAEVIDEEETIDLDVNLEFDANPRTNHDAFDVETFTFEIEGN
ncbi:Mg-chelatase subunit ChlD [Halovivax ruber XH-70]|uniref:Mg-chelatase subunit ChlD n=1 Tax=Halovivax ruber (strain DSM 18193 / JCM 13892 / XH-70) TaxID=797302 RepID=L0ICH5_HALRX|nr:vWA domain-containing protein [Halovivax ruber]AGB16528.1 Mg-chelatase subunit ChlD [Halovivax ruber XH-70]